MKTRKEAKAANQQRQDYPSDIVVQASDHNSSSCCPAGCAAMALLREMELRLLRLLTRLEKTCASKAQTIPFPNNPLLTVAEAANYLHLSKGRIYMLHCSGALKSMQQKKRGRLLFTREELDRFLSPLARPF